MEIELLLNDKEVRAMLETAVPIRRNLLAGLELKTSKQYVDVVYKVAMLVRAKYPAFVEKQDDEELWDDIYAAVDYLVSSNA